MLTGGETGGEWISDVHGREANSGVNPTADMGGSAGTRTDASGVDVTSDELLIAGR